MTIKDLAQAMSRLDLDSLKQQAAKKNQRVIVESQRKQMRKGENAEGMPIGKYRPRYARYKATLSTYMAPIGVPDLYLTGAFHKGIRMATTATDYTLTSTDPKTGKLTAKYGQIFGLNQGSLPAVQTACTKSLGEIIKRRLKLSG